MERKANSREVEFPKPIYIGNKRFFRLSTLLAYDAHCAGESIPSSISPQNEKYLTAGQVRERYGGVSDMWLWRRLNPDRAKT